MVRLRAHGQYGEGVARLQRQRPLDVFKADKLPDGFHLALKQDEQVHVAACVGLAAGVGAVEDEPSVPLLPYRPLSSRSRRPSSAARSAGSRPEADTPEDESEHRVPEPARFMARILVEVLR